MKNRCNWVTKDDIYISYHDYEWGVPEYDSYKLFEHLILDSHQAGLSWLTILKKRDNYRMAFDNFDPNKIALYDDYKILSLLNDKGIIRNKLKINSTIHNAKAFLNIQKETTSFSNYIWSFTGGRTKNSSYSSSEDIPTKTPESESMAKGLKNWGFKFIGPTICYAFMQAVGMVNDHTTDCFRYYELLE